MSRRRLWLSRCLILGLTVVALQQTWRHGHDYVFADKFAEIEPGRIYRGAWQKTWPMQRILRNYRIKTIVALAHPPDHPLAIREKALAAEFGVNWIHIPIVDQRDDKDRESVSDLLEKAAAVLADPANQPVYFHCHHGINRASMVHIAYRTMYCGETLDEALAEVTKSFGLVTVSQGPDYRHMETFYRDRVLPRRLAQAARSKADLSRE